MTAPLIPVTVGAHVVTRRDGPDRRCVQRSGRWEPIHGIVVHLIGPSVDIVQALDPDSDLEWHLNIPLRSIDDDQTDPPIAFYIDDIARRLLAHGRRQDVIALMQAVVHKPRHALAQQEEVA